MSYILDALRRADAERQRGLAPVLQQVTGAAAWLPAPAQRPTLRRLLPWLALALVVLLALLTLASLLGWWFAAPEPVPARAARATAQPVAAPRLPTAASAARAAPARPAVSAAAPQRTRPALPARGATSAASAALVSVTASAVGPRPIAVSALPEPLRSAVARLAIGGAVHSQDRNQSFVLVGGQLVREGETLAPGITLERIAARSLSLRVGEWLVELPL